ncbi:MAG: PHP domain-containing protein [Mycoplasmataceae bacterium]|nr:PHP domain-containing protein [Mycoplasmataceae bacterium]
MKIISFKHNYHTHTIYCHHAVDTVEQMVKYAIKNHYLTLGFSEHAPLNVIRKRRLNWKDLDNYINEVNIAKIKYKKQIKILCGLECEYDSSQYKYYKNLRNKVDYLISGNHNKGNPHLANAWNSKNIDLDQYTKQTIDACKCGLFSYIAHPDYIFKFYHAWDEDAINMTNDIVDASLKYDIPLGFNLNGLKNKQETKDYPNNYFWQVVGDTKCKVLIEADAHDHRTLSKTVVNRGIRLIKKWGLTDNVIENLKIR